MVIPLFMVLIPLLISTLSYFDSWNSAILGNVPHCTRAQSLPPAHPVSPAQRLAEAVQFDALLGPLLSENIIEPAGCRLTLTETVTRTCGRTKGWPFLVLRAWIAPPYTRLEHQRHFFSPCHGCTWGSVAILPRESKMSRCISVTVCSRYIDQERHRSVACNFKCFPAIM